MPVNNRVGSAKIALEQAGEAAKGAVLASDAFFPFGDTVETAAKHGIAAIIQQVVLSVKNPLRLLMKQVLRWYRHSSF